MKLTKEKIRNLYKKYNHLYFDDLLPNTLSVVLNNEHAIASVVCAKERKTKKIKVALWLSDKYEWSSLTLRDVILHEMIHVYVYVKIGHLPYFRQHGINFKRKMKSLNKQYGFNITVKATSDFIKNLSKKELRTDGVDADS